MGVIGLDGVEGAAAKNVSALIAANAGGLSQFAFRLAAMAWVPLSVVANAGFTLEFLHHFAPPQAGHVDKVGAAINTFSVVFDLYEKWAAFLFQPVQDFVHQHASGFMLPVWSPDLAAIYAATASALYFSSLTVAAREQFIEQAQGTAAAASWPVAIVGLLWGAIRGRFVAGFATKHTLVFASYIAACAAAAWALINFAPQIAHAIMTAI